MTELDKDAAQPHIAFLLYLQSTIKLMRSDVPLFPEQIADPNPAGTGLILDCTAET